MGLGTLLALLCKQNALLVYLTRVHSGRAHSTNKPRPGSNKCTHIQKKLAKKTDHFDSGHDGLVDDVTVG